MKPIKAKKSLGQNFLIDDEALTDIARSIEIAGRHIIEVWPGYGALTSYILSHHPDTLDLVELDPDMIELLDARFMGDEVTPEIHDAPETLVGTSPITIHHQDVLTFSPPYDEYSVIANIPYYITSPILFHFLYPEYASSQSWKVHTWNPPTEMTIMMQEEVWEKILEWRAKKPHHSYLSLAMELACEDIDIVRYVGRASFDPAPKVDSIVLRFRVKRERNREQEETLLALWRASFAQPRKTLLSNLRWTHYDIERVKLWLTVCGYDEKVRAEAVRLEDWYKLKL